MSKKVYADDIKNDQKKTKEKLDQTKNDKQENKDTSDAGGASGFSDEAEKKFQEKKKRKDGKVT